MRCRARSKARCRVSTEQGSNQSIKQSTEQGIELNLAKFRSVTITQSCVNISRYAVSQNTKWGRAPPLEKSIQIANV